MMIQSAPEGEPRFVSLMTEHMDLCRQFAEAFGNDRFEKPEPYDETLYAIAHHDRGWDRFDAAPVLDPKSGFPAGVGGAIVLGEGYTPAQQGTIIYLPGGDDLTAVLARVEPAGGTIVVPKTEIGGDFGFYAHFIGTEGNKVGLHSMG